MGLLIFYICRKTIVRNFQFAIDARLKVKFLLEVPFQRLYFSNRKPSLALEKLLAVYFLFLCSPPLPLPPHYHPKKKTTIAKSTMRNQKQSKCELNPIQPLLGCALLTITLYPLYSLSNKKGSNSRLPRYRQLLNNSFFFFLFNFFWERTLSSRTVLLPNFFLRHQLSYLYSFK